MMTIKTLLMLSVALPQNCPAPLDEVVADIVSDGGYLVDLIDVDSEHLDQLMVVVANRNGTDSLVVGGVKDGCVVTKPYALDTVERGTPA